MDKEQFKKLGEKIGVDFNKTNLDQFIKGVKTEYKEHGPSDPQTDVVGNDLTIAAKIALAHLKEIPDYYNKLEAMEGDSEK